MLEHREIKPAVTQDLKDRLANLTRRESEVLEHVLDGKSNDEIAMELFRSPKTIDKHCQNIYQKTGIHKRVNLVREVLQHRAASSIAVQEHEAVTKDAIKVLIKKSSAWDRLQEFHAELSHSIGVEYFAKLANSLAAAFGVRMAGICEVNNLEGYGDIIACSVDGEFIPPLQYDLQNSACGTVFADGSLEAFDDLEARYGHAENLLLEQGMISYVGMRLCDRLYGNIGTLWIAHDQAISADDMPLTILKLYAPSVAVELATQKALDDASSPAGSE